MNSLVGAEFPEGTYFRRCGSASSCSDSRFAQHTKANGTNLLFILEGGSYYDA